MAPNESLCRLTWKQQVSEMESFVAVAHGYKFWVFWFSPQRWKLIIREASTYPETLHETLYSSEESAKNGAEVYLASMLGFSIMD